MSLCEHGKYEGHCSICIENIPAEPVYTDPRMIGIDTPTPDSEMRTELVGYDDIGSAERIVVDKTIRIRKHNGSQDNEIDALYTIEQVVQMIMAHEGIRIQIYTAQLPGMAPDWLFPATKEIISILQGKE